MDDGSTDDTKEVVKLYLNCDNRFKYYGRDDNYCKGANSCRHIGYLKSEGDYINWFDSDDLMDSQNLAKKVKKIVERNYDFVSCEIATFKGKGLINSEKINNNYSKDQEVVNQFVGKLTLHTAGPLWSKCFLEENSLYYKMDKTETQDTVLNDWVFSLKALLKSSNFSFIHEVLVFYRIHENSIYSERRKLNPHKFLEEFTIRKNVYKLVKSEIGNDKNIEQYYLKRNLKIVRVLLIKKSRSFHVLIEILKNRSVGLLFKSKIVFYYIIAILTGRGINKLRIK